MAKYKLKDLCEFITDGTHQTPEYCEKGGIKFLSSKDVVNQKINWDNVKYIPKSLHEKLYKRLSPRKDDILLAKNGTTGVAAIVDREDIFDVYVSLAVLRPLDIVYPKYLLYAINSQITKRQFDAGLKGVGVPNLHLSVIRETSINVVPKEKQKKICNILDKIKLIIDLENQKLNDLDYLIQSRFVELFGDAVYNDKKWETDTVKNLCKEIYGGGTPSKAHPEYYKDGDIPWVSAKDMKTDVLKDSQIKINQLGVDNSTARLVPVNSVIMVIRSGILKHTLPVAVNKVPITVNQDLKVFIPGERILTRFLAVQFKMQEKDILSGVRAVTADNIEFNSLKQRRMIVPPIDLQQKYLMFLERIDKSKFVIHKFLYCTTHNTKSIIKPRPNTKESGKIRGGKPHADEF